ncbi:MAG: HAD-IA family hydrolase, partial [Candidatus Aminicenantes bacterium]|nr:HAD-IA family hydrolase [Candidatus Aminicenantes bacterium]
LDRLASQAMRFTDAYAACPVCTPTRASIMTGKYPARLDITNWFYGRIKRKLVGAPYVENLPLEEVTLAEAFKAAGYKTLLLSNTDSERFVFVRHRFPEIMFFDDYVLSYELKLLKPDPAIYLAAARLAGTLPGECVFIDDMEENIAGAVATGLAGIHYRPETDLAAELKKLNLNF